jgi:hypothetical protein
MEPDSGSWRFDGVDGLTPALHRDDGGESDLDPAIVRSAVERALRDMPPAWDPYA